MTFLKLIKMEPSRCVDMSHCLLLRTSLSPWTFPRSDLNWGQGSSPASSSAAASWCDQGQMAFSVLFVIFICKTGSLHKTISSLIWTKFFCFSVWAMCRTMMSGPTTYHAYDGGPVRSCTQAVCILGCTIWVCLRALWCLPVASVTLWHVFQVVSCPYCRTSLKYKQGSAESTSGSLCLYALSKSR